jgi:hypothetical protein
MLTKLIDTLLFNREKIEEKLLCSCFYRELILDDLVYDVMENRHKQIYLFPVEILIHNLVMYMFEQENIKVCINNLLMILNRCDHHRWILKHTNQSYQE